MRLLFLRTGPDIADNCVRELARAGFDPSHGTAAGPEELAALLDHEKYDLVLTEYAAAGWNWSSALAALRALPEPIPLLVLAREADSRVLMDCVLEGAADCIRFDEIYRLPLSVRHVLELRTARHPGTSKVVQADLRFRQMFDAFPDAILQVDDRVGSHWRIPWRGRFSGARLKNCQACRSTTWCQSVLRKDTQRSPSTRQPVRGGRWALPWTYGPGAWMEPSFQWISRSARPTPRKAHK